jgi:hypothetical protein
MNPTVPAITGIFSRGWLGFSRGSLALFGAVRGVFVLVSVVSGQFVGIRQPWIGIALRVVGSWIAAAGLLMVGWLVRGAF